jgi:hypothetical protein
VGNYIDVRFTVTNTGLATAYNVLPSWDPAQISGNYLLTTPAPLNGLTGAPLGGGLTLTSGSSATFSWRFQANVSQVGPVPFSASATGMDPMGTMILSPITYSAGVQVQPGASQPAVLASSLVRMDGGPLNGPYGLGQTITLRFTVSNTAVAGNNAFVGLTPTVIGTGAWSALSVVAAPALVSVQGVGAVASPMNLPPGASATYDVVLMVTQTATATSGDNINVTVGGSYTDSALGAGLPIILTAGFVMGVQPAYATSVAVMNEIFLSHNTFYPPADTLIVNFTVKTSGNVRVTIYDVAGERVRSLYDGYAAASANPNQAVLYSGLTDARLRWDGLADDGHAASSGTYLIYFEAPGFNDIKKVNLLR